MSRELNYRNHQARATQNYERKLLNRRQSNVLVRACVEHPYLCGLFCVLAISAGMAAIPSTSASSSDLAIPLFPMADPAPELAIAARPRVVKAPKAPQKSSVKAFAQKELHSALRFSKDISDKDKTTAENKLLKAFEELQAHPETFGFTSRDLHRLFKSGLKIEVVKNPPANILASGQAARLNVTSSRADRSAGGTIYFRLKDLTKGLCEGQAGTELILLTSVLQEELTHAMVYQEGGTFCLQGRLPPCSKGGHLVDLTVNIKQMRDPAAVDAEFNAVRAAIQKDLKNLPARLEVTTSQITTLSAGMYQTSANSRPSCYEDVSAESALTQHVQSIRDEFSHSSSSNCSPNSLLGAIEAEAKINTLPKTERERYFPNYSKFSAQVWQENQKSCPAFRHQYSLHALQEFSRKPKLSEGERGMLAREIEANRFVLAENKTMTPAQRQDLDATTQKLETLFKAQEDRADARVRVEL